MNFEEIKQQILDFAKAQQVELDYTAKSIDVLDEILEIFHEKLNQRSEEEGDALLAEWAQRFGCYMVRRCCTCIWQKKGFHGR